MRRAWVVRAGDKATEIEAMRASGMIGVRYESVGDVRTMTAKEIESAIASTGETGVDALRSRLMRFVNDVRVGDLVVTPNVSGHDLWISIVTGAYEYVDQPTVAGYLHIRAAQWRGWIDRDAAWLQHKLKYLDVPGAVVELRDADWWFDQIDSRDLPAERGPRRFRPAPPPPVAQARRSAPPTARASPPKPPERVLCAGQCGLQWSTAILVGGLCPDCRGD